ncbi:MAG: hypothetical protein LUQ50_11000 [Methanospirillum sp.]|uniref:hypothetical protein n=1 Tax=Methanospirillum sp. TaxID=45200 RepID=UPI00236AC8B4|nr:hypothetical protein [Methanospirillum sp.]MDD1729581.1 hypothetical protein [Methanospirillum sp.]
METKDEEETAMVLEEEIYFSSQDIAKEFVKLLKDLGISTQMRQKFSLDIRLMLSGTYTNLTTMFESLITADDATEEEVELFTQTRDHLKSQRDVISQAFQRYNIGDRVGSGVMDLITGDRTLEGDESEDALEAIIEEVYLTRLLHLNELLEVGENGLTLSKKIEPDAAVLTIFADEIPAIMDEVLEKFQIQSIITAGDDGEWHVSIGPEFVFLDDLTSIGEFLEEYEIDEEEGAAFFPRIQIKHLLVSEILGMIKDGGKVSREDIIGEFADRDIETHEDESQIALHLSAGYIGAVLDDLKKAGILKGKDQKLRIAV